MADTPQRIFSRFLVLGEGADETLLFQSLLRHLGILDAQVEAYHGKDKLRAFLTALLKRPGISNVTRLCITRDADEQPIAETFQSIGDALTANGLPVPLAHDSISYPSGDLRVGVYLLPGENRCGAFEDLCLDMIATDPAGSCVENFFQCLDKSGIARPNSSSMLAKAKVHAWLASREVADLARMGLAAKEAYQYIRWEHPAFEPLKQFLRELFAEPPISHE